MILARFRGQLDELASYLALVEERGDGVQVILTYEPGQPSKKPKVTVHAQSLTPERKRA